MPTAREKLTTAHKRMTADEIAANALDLANTVEMLTGALNSAYDALRAADLYAQSCADNCRNLHLTVQRAQSLFASRRKAEARELIAGISAIPLEDIPPRSAEDLGALVAPPVEHLFNPKDSAT